MKIFDCFPFFNELELLELRLMTLNKVVDYFVLVEANRTQTGRRKEFIFENNRNRFKKYLDRIIHVKIEDIPKLDKSKDIWTIEYFQRNCITRGLSSAQTEDKIMISDLDEIPDPDRILQVKDNNDTITFSQHLFYYYINCMSPRNWNGSIITPFENMPLPQELRKLARRGINRIENGGWHYSYMGGVDRIKEKLDNLCEGFMVKDRVGTDENIIQKINSQKSLWDERCEYGLINIEEDGLAPKCIKEFIEKYPSFYFRQN